MLHPTYTNQFEKDLKRALKSSRNVQKIKTLIEKLINQENLENKYRDHILLGKYKGRRECRIEPDWLLIYKMTSEAIIFERTGSHSELFK